MLTKEQIFAALCVKSEEVDVPELGGSIILRTMSGIDRDKYLDLVRDKVEGNSYFSAALIVCTAVDAEGNKLFTADDIPDLRTISVSALNTISNAAAEMNGFNKKPEQTAA